MPHRLETLAAFLGQLFTGALLGASMIGWAELFKDPFWYSAAVVVGGGCFGWATIVYDGRTWGRRKFAAAVGLSAAASLLVLLAAWQPLFKGNPAFLAMMGLLAGTAGPPMLSGMRRKYLKRFTDDGDDNHQLACSDHKDGRDDPQI